MPHRTLVNPAWFLLTVLTGCGQRIPSVVSPAEFEVYSAWIKHAYKKQPEGMLYLATETSIQQLDRCKEKLRRQGVDSLRQQLADLGQAKYVFQPQQSILSSWPFKEAEEFPPRWLPVGAFRYVQFTRVAFNRERTQALFAVAVERGYHFSNNDGPKIGGVGGQTEIGGGSGGALIARRQKGTWSFSDMQCIWLE